MTMPERKPQPTRRVLLACCGLGAIVCVGALAEVLRSRRLDPIDVDAVISQLGNPDITVQHDAQWTLVRKGRIPLLRALRDASPEVRASAAHALGLLRDPETTMELLHALNDEYNYTRMWSAFSLGEMGDVTVSQALVDRMYMEADPNVRVYIMEALVKLRADDTVPHMIAQLADVDEYVVSHAVAAIVALGGADTIAHLLPLTHDSDVPRRKAAIYCICALDGEVGVMRVPYSEALEFAWEWWHSEGERKYSK